MKRIKSVTCRTVDKMTTFETVEVRDASGKELKGFMVSSGLRTSTFGQSSEETANVIHNVADLPIRGDDILFWSGPKSGMNSEALLVNL